jgi:hypothetical protein
MLAEEVQGDILAQFKSPKPPSEESIEYKHGKYSPFVSGGLPSLGKRR